MCGYTLLLTAISGPSKAKLRWLAIAASLAILEAAHRPVPHLTRLWLICALIGFMAAAAIGLVLVLAFR